MSEINDQDEVTPTLKSVTIRGVDGGVYDEFSKVIQMAGLTMGEAITKMMGDVKRDFDETFPDLSAESFRLMVKKDRINVQHHERLSISRKDLEDANRGIRFQHIRDLTFEADVTEEVFNTYVRSIQHCGTVRVPSVLPKLQIYAKITFTDSIEIYVVEDEQ
ncbi:hypothetical protein ISS40_10945 [Candidatus Bathyarchaeota archaeon]|nr:hypothetical protein [Candidatus Bathyarchaeota archaeon]MBL7169180.1 hypothetical protein [Candidatus Bathyarchaeota archaeon]